MKQIPNHPDYFVTMSGQVYSTVRGSLYELKQMPNTNQYLTVTLNGRRHYVHRLVAQAYIPNPNNYPCVCHHDDVKTNNIVENLWWGTLADNNHDRSTKGRTARQYGINNGRNGGAVVINGVTYPTAADAARALGLHPSTVYTRLRNKTTGYHKA
jgi:hypothetical protein